MHTPYPMGVTVINDNEVRFSFVSDAKECGIILCDKTGKKEKRKIAFSDEDRIGRVYTKIVNMKKDELSYRFYEMKKEKQMDVPDPYLKAVATGWSFGQEIGLHEINGIINENEFDWENDQLPNIPEKDMIAYCMHVRGFTKHRSSKVKHSGTFMGVIEKIPYLKELGITTIEMQPIYEFIEKGKNDTNLISKPTDSLINYWGYKKGFYYAPKNNYSASKDAVSECKEMIKALHKEKIECIMQIFVDDSMNIMQLNQIMEHWMLQYHIDGFHILGKAVAMDEILQNPLFQDIKIWYQKSDLQDTVLSKKLKHIALYEDGYLFDIRKFLKGDEDCAGKTLQHMRTLGNGINRVKFLSNYYGFTLMDTFSYERKHNENNLEENRDGNDYNNSWNCGEEGPSRKRKVKSLRTKLYKNALTILLFSTGIPLIFMGDEFGNSQQGNNNPYCQDNEITWLNWDLVNKNHELLSFFKYLVNFRNSHSVLHPEKEHQMFDSLGYGYPDLSYHGENAWRPDLSCYIRSLGLMYSGHLNNPMDQKQDDYIYLGMNMHWEIHNLALPRLPKGYEWKMLFTTCEDVVNSDVSNDLLEVAPRSVKVMVGLKIK